MSTPPPPAAPPPPPPIDPPQPPGGFAQPQPQPPSAGTNGKAIASLVLGIVGLTAIFCVFPGVASVLAIIFGHMARNEIDAGSGQEGRGMAVAGFVMGIIGVVVTALWIILIVIAGVSSPNN